MKFEEFIFTDEGHKLTFPFKKIFGGFLGILEPGNTLVYATNNEVFKIPCWETPDGFKNVIQRSIKEKKNLLIQRYKEYKVVYNPDFVY